MKILVTGATGNVGGRLAEQLLADGHHVRALVRNPAAALPAGIEKATGDLTDLAGLETALTDVDGVFLYTSAGGEPLTNGQELVDLASRLGVHRAVSLWSGFDGTVETALRASRLEWTILQPMEFMLNALTWAASIRDEGVVREPFAELRSTAIHEADIAAVAAAALTRDGHTGETYEITGPRALTFHEKIDILGNALGRDLRFEELTRQQAHDRLTAQGVSGEVADHVVGWHADPPESAYTVRHTVEQVTGRPPRDFTQWVAENRNAFA